ncbi:REP-associated tyrosine transposase [Methylobacter tundripaludum]|jgi:REP element-mobilizing transposase RayT|uniref:REP-associated tyrosine transposase n=1 Tax=Methylobacter tundripaludum TaxID=173365 RepID=UPI000488C5D3|nr:transposase [Methylobacter tundripaludum]
MPRDDLRKGRVSLAYNAYFVTTVTQNRIPYFQDFYCARLLVTEMRRLHEENQLESLAWVIMPDHLHWLFQLQEDQNLSEIVRLLKGRSAHRVNHYLLRQGSIWDRAFHDHALRKDEDIKNIARYIVANPLRAKLVEKLDDYPMWDAAWL